MPLFPELETSPERAATKPHQLSNGSRNKLQSSDQPVHDWYRFVLSFPPHLVVEYLRRFGLQAGQVVLDPFCGTGTTIVEAKLSGFAGWGIEANPMACFASKVKTDWSISPEGLWTHANQVAAAANEKLLASGIEDDPLFELNQHEKLILRTLETEATKLLLQNSISPLPLHKVLVLIDTLNELKSETYDNHERLALARALVYTISNLRFGPEVGVGKAKVDTPVVAAWLTEVRRMVSDLELLKRRNSVEAKVYLSDSRHVGRLLPPASVDAVITSPPYPNEKDYTRTTRLESVLLGFITSHAQLRELKRSLIRSNTRTVYKHDNDDAWVANHPEIRRIADSIEQRRIELGKTSGFERMYARVTRLYFGGMSKHLAELRQVLKPGAQLAYVVGDQASFLRVMIRTGRLLADLAQSLGYEVIGIELFRTRLATATKEQLREEVVLLRWPGESSHR